MASLITTPATTDQPSLAEVRAAQPQVEADVRKLLAKQRKLRAPLRDMISATRDLAWLATVRDGAHEHIAQIVGSGASGAELVEMLALYDRLIAGFREHAAVLIETASAIESVVGPQGERR